MKKIFCLLAAAVFFISFSACSGNQEQKNDVFEETVSENEEIFDPKIYNYTEKDAQNLVQWNLDMIYKGSISEEGAESFGFTMEDVEQFHINEILMDSEILVDLVGGEKYYEDIHERCFSIMEKLYLKTNYTVGKATKTDDGSFEVSVEITPFLWMEYFETQFLERLEELYVEYPEMSFENVSEEEYEKYEKILSEKILEILEEIPDNAKYGDPETIFVEVYQLEDGTWNTTEESFYMMISEILK